MSDNTFSDDDYCFACGTKNPIGLKLKFTSDGDCLYTDFILSKEYQGWDRVIHGGILATVMDEVQVNLAAAKGYAAPTAEITARFIKPAEPDKKYRASAYLKEIKHGRLIFTEAEITDTEGTVYCKSSAKLMITGKVDPAKMRLKNKEES